MQTKSKTPKAPSKRKSAAKPASTIEVSSPTTEPETSLASPFAVGDRVSHPIFGDGVVEAIRGDAVRTKFETHGVKEIIAPFLKPLKRAR